MRFSPLVDRIGGEGVAAWEIHYRAVKDQRAGRDVIILSVGDPDFDTPAAITDATIAAMRAGETHYSDLLGLEELRAVIARRFQAKTGQATTFDNVAVMSGAQCGLFASALCLLAPGDEVIVPEPMYVTYEATLQAPGAKIVSVPQRAENDFHLDAEEVARAITPRTRAIYFATPCNPTGAMMTRAALERIAQLAIRHDLWVVSDEVYATLTFGKEHVSIAGLPGMADRTVTVSSLSKSHAMTGWRMGWIVGPKVLIDHVHNLSMAMLYGLPTFLQRGAVVALEQDLAEVEIMRRTYQRRRDAAVARLNRVAGLKCHLPDAGMFMMLDVRGTGLGSGDFAEKLYDATGVAVLDATAFGRSAAGHVRVSFVADDKSLEEACRRISAFVRDLPGLPA
ncbi:MAG TPA: pyridoxal phosphate-dependent aminotransferase [Dongiaceae bacterium]|jgi:aspartate/methionine/tyrosine aminotransferase|nr:pyridoxal phosphate-dependent aminotransferase [Dongiaceae bacterium]